MEFCQHQSICGGCQFTHLEYDQEVSQKSNFFQYLLLRLGFSRAFAVLKGDGKGQRVRTDFTLLNGKLGFYSAQGHEVFDLRHCEHWVPQLHNAFERFQKFHWPFQKASFRLRVSPDGQTGLWMDLSNLDVKSLLDNSEFVHGLLSTFDRVEVGQRFKTLYVDERARIQETDPSVWFETRFQDHKIPLHTFIGGFTQPSLVFNEKIINQIADWLGALSIEHTLELGSGIGNLTFPLLAHSKKVTALENSKPALQGLDKTLSLLPEILRQDIISRLNIVRGDFQLLSRSTEEVRAQEFDLVFCNPPRSGLMGFAEQIVKINPQYLMYMSCYPESMEKDLQILLQANYRLQKASLIDQFPRSKHFEAMVLLQRV